MNQNQVVYKMSKCLNCGKDCRNKYCCNDCQLDYQWKMRKIEIEKSGCFLQNEKNDQKVRRIAKKYLTEKHGNKCSICGTEEWLGKPILLLVDHIDGNVDNYNIDNYRLICSNCDATLPTYKNKNKGNGRSSRRKLL